jgi:hypothetical protein
MFQRKHALVPNFKGVALIELSVGKRVVDFGRIFISAYTVAANIAKLN